jgi:hypothetical protein
MFFYANISYRNVFCSNPFLQNVEMLLANITITLALVSRAMDYYNKEMQFHEGKATFKRASLLSFIE